MCRTRGSGKLWQGRNGPAKRTATPIAKPSLTRKVFILMGQLETLFERAHEVNHFTH